MERQKRRVYDSEFKRNAVLLSLEEDRSVSQVAKNLGISKDTLYKWRHAYSANSEKAFPGNGKSSLTDEQKQIKALEKQVNDIKVERDILKKAVAIFSRASK